MLLTVFLSYSAHQNFHEATPPAQPPNRHFHFHRLVPLFTLGSRQGGDGRKQKAVGVSVANQMPLNESVRV